jgi:uracil-DNA glycosylase
MDEDRRLGYLSAMGIDLWVPRKAPVHRLEPADAVSIVASPPEPTQSAEPDDSGPIQAAGPAAEPQPVDVAGAEARASLDASRMDWSELETAVSGCRACGLCETRTRTVFGVGNRCADLLIIGEAPGAEEDRAGEPFVGRAGQLLDRMLAGIGLVRDQVYIANVLKCRPPGNRDPRPEEARQCEGYLMRQIALIDPRFILCVGRIAAQHLLQTDASVGSLRGRWLTLGHDALPLRVTYHPAYLLRSPEQKAKAWDDLLAVAWRLREPEARQ